MSGVGVGLRRRFWLVDLEASHARPIEQVLEGLAMGGWRVVSMSDRWILLDRLEGAAGEGVGVTQDG